MEAILISPDRVKIILNASELDRYGIDVSDLYGSVKSETLKSILADITPDVCFDSRGCRLAVQVYACRGGCEIYVTKMPLEDENEGIYIVMCHGLNDANALIRRINGYKKCVLDDENGSKSAKSDVKNHLFCTEKQLYFMSDTPLPEFVCDYGQIIPRSSECYIKEYGRSVSLPE